MLLCEAWSGQRPFDGLTPLEVRQRVLAGQRPQLPASAPSALEALVHGCWAEAAADRPSAADAAERLRDLAQRTPAQPPRVRARGAAEPGERLAGGGIADSLDALTLRR